MNVLNAMWAGGMDGNEFAKPYIERALGVEMVLVDKGTDELSSILDRKCGIDALIVHGDNVYGTALRTQRGRNWGTFTIRYQRTSGRDTEWQKATMEPHRLSPAITMQIYITPTDIHLGYAYSDDLYAFARANVENGNLEVKTANDEGNKFVVVPWSNLGFTPWFKSVTVPIQTAVASSWDLVK